MESPAPAAAHSVQWLQSMLFLPTPCQLFEMNLSQLTSGEGLQRKYDWEYVTSDIIPRTSTVLLAQYNLQPCASKHIG